MLAEFFRQKDIEVLTAGQTKINEETITLADKNVIDIETVKTPFRDEWGNVVGLIGIAREITVRHNIEKQYLQQENYLEIRAIAHQLKGSSE